MADPWTDEYDQAWVRVARQTWSGVLVTPTAGSVMLSYGRWHVWGDVHDPEELSAVVRELRVRISRRRADEIIGVRPASRYAPERQ